MLIHQSGGKRTVFLRQISPYFGISQQFRIVIGRFQNLLNKALWESWMLGLFKSGKQLPNLVNSSPTGEGWRGGDQITYFLSKVLK